MTSSSAALLRYGEHPRHSNSFTIDSFFLYILHRLRVTSYDSWPFHSEEFRITMCSGSFSKERSYYSAPSLVSSHVFRTLVTYVATSTTVTRDDYVSIGFTWYFLVPRIKLPLEYSVVNIIHGCYLRNTQCVKNVTIITHFPVNWCLSACRASTIPISATEHCAPFYSTSVATWLT